MKIKVHLLLSRISRNELLYCFESQPDFNVETSFFVASSGNSVDPEVVISDFLNGEVPWQDLIAIKSKNSNLRIVLIVGNTTRIDLAEMQVAGVEAIIHRIDLACDSMLLPKVTTLVAHGGFYLSPRVVSTTRSLWPPTVESDKSVREKLTETELKVVQLINKGKTSREIGDIIFKSPRTVDDIRDRIKSKLNVRSKEELIAYTSRWKWDTY